MFDLTGKVALVTGASSGIGFACAIALASQGASVVVSARRVDKLNDLVHTITEQGKKATALALDVTDLAQISSVVAKTIETYGRLDILVNNAGALDYTPFLDMPEEKWNLIINTNLKGYFFVAQAAAREMVKNKWGRIINIASIASGGVGVGFPMLSHYGASKGGVIGLTEALAVELGPQGILVNAIGPGGIETEMTKGLTPEQATAMFSRLPIKRIGKPEEIASAVVYFASEESSYTTGTTLYVDGGWLTT
ncbi:3-oxoacyl-ACP reductase FabG [Candidatus Woesebacteria bacterium]|jgi:NAD(P)-dependent dehydrogenase (short-subunit alcohol dehydrogenase family)|nr:3-oxoacyl-ACP reductase FabG [Candidatus Woesebacteria bacterium]